MYVRMIVIYVHGRQEEIMDKKKALEIVKGMVLTHSLFTRESRAEILDALEDIDRKEEIIIVKPARYSDSSLQGMKREKLIQVLRVAEAQRELYAKELEELRESIDDFVLEDRRKTIDKILSYLKESYGCDDCLYDECCGACGNEIEYLEKMKGK